MYETEHTLYETWGKLKEEEKERTPPDLSLREFSLNSLTLAPEVFQTRTLSEDDYLLLMHIQDLAYSVKQDPRNELDPVIIWWSGERWYVIDGHLRIEAYRLYEKENKTHIGSIPVEVFEGSLTDALKESTRLNAKNKLAMTRDDKQNRAWQLVVLDEGHSKKEIALICRVGTATVGRMRQRLREIREKYGHNCQAYCLRLSWAEARTEKQEDENYDEDWEERQALEWAKRLARAFGDKAATQPRPFLRALELYSERLYEELVEAAREEPREFDEEFEYDF